MAVTRLTLFVIGLTLSTAAAQNSQPTVTDESFGPVWVRLEAHKGQTRFQIGDVVVVDLVFTSHSPGYAVDTATRPYLPPADLPEITPNAGWIRSHTVLTGQSMIDQPATLGSEPIRVPILLNRSITFQQPGHYEVSVSSERVRNAQNFARLTSLDSCNPCATTNDVGIDIEPRNKSDEAALVASLLRELEETKGIEPVGLSQEQTDNFRRRAETLQMRPDMTEAEQKAILQKLNEVVQEELATVEKRRAQRREAAIRLAYLPGDEALRAKVHFIAISDEEVGEGEPIGPIMLDGLPSSNNKQLQLELIEGAWRDPNHLPTDVLQDALREARELANGQTVTEYSSLWAGTSEQQRAAARKEYQDELNELIATLPLRSEANRAKTIEYMKRLAFPNQFNGGQK